LDRVKETTMKHLRLLTALLVLGFATGCATVVHGVHQDVWVETEPPGATASADGQTITTPGALRLHRSANDLEVVVEKEGYVTRRVPLTRRTSGAVWGNLGFIPFGVAAGAAIGSTSTKDSTKWFSEIEGGTYGGLIGGLVAPAAAIAVDYATGGAYKLDPPTIILRLEPVSAAAPESL
jgi:hypothetical protein